MSRTSWSEPTSHLSRLSDRRQVGITVGRGVRDCTADFDHATDMEPTGEKWAYSCGAAWILEFTKRREGNVTSVPSLEVVRRMHLSGNPTHHRTFHTSISLNAMGFYLVKPIFGKHVV